MNRRGPGRGSKSLSWKMAFEVSLSERVHNSATVAFLNATISYGLSIINVPV